MKEIGVRARSLTRPQVKAHPFFKNRNVNWDTVLSQQPAFIPKPNIDYHDEVELSVDARMGIALKKAQEARAKQQLKPVDPAGGLAPLAATGHVPHVPNQVILSAPPPQSNT